MTSDHVKQNAEKYPPTLHDVFHAVNAFAYDSTYHIEGPYGEGYGGRIGPFNYERLVNATIESIHSSARGKSWSGTNLRKTLATAGLSDAELDRIVDITLQEALLRIKDRTSEDKKIFHEHGHHGRQYIARNTVERVMKEILPL